MACEICRKEPPADEPMYQVVMTTNHPWIQIIPYAVVYICEDCRDRHFNNSYPRNWMLPRSCDGCGRAVLHEARYRPRIPRKHIVCCRGCRSKLYNTFRRARRFTRKCDTCGEPFTPKRRDARHCSPACRQKAYRDRARV